MANYKISGLPAGSSSSATDEFEANQAGTSRKVTRGKILDFPLTSRNSNYTLALTDDLTTVSRDSGAGAFTWTIPTNATVAFRIGARVRFANFLASTSVNIAADTGVTLRGDSQSGTVTLQAGCMIEAIKVATNTWLILGAAPQYGAYTPTVSTVSNCTSTTGFQTLYTRCGSIVDVSGILALTPVSANAVTSVSITVPIPSALTDTVNDAAGVAVSSGATSNSYVGFVRADGAGKLLMQFYATATNAASFRFNAKYLIG